MFEDGSGLSCSAWGPKIRHSMERIVMDEPGWWTHATVIQPARTETHRLEHRFLRGCDADLFLWARLQEAA